MAVARALRTRSVAAMFAWSLACVFVAWAVVFTLHRSIHLAVAMLAAITIAALIVGRRESIGLVERARARLDLRGGARLVHVARREPGRRRRPVPRGARAQAGRPDEPAPAHRRRVQGRRPPSGLCVSALARLPRSRLVVLRRRPRAGRAPRAVAAGTARVCAGVRGGCRCSRLAQARGRRARGAARARLLRAGPRRLVRGAVAAGDGLAPADGPGGDHALLRAHEPGAATRRSWRSSER